jgi:Rieske Fe-S protein
MSGSGGASRRAMLLAAGAAGAVSVLAACGDDPGSSPQTAAPTTPGDPVRIPIASVPIGGGYIDFDRGVIVTQPEAGQFRGFDANCTHARCFITWVADGLIQCPCHGSHFRIADGSVARGPATRPLDTRAVTVDGDVVVVS